MKETGAAVYGIEAQDFQTLRTIAARLQNGTDRERDEGHRLWLVLSRAEPIEIPPASSSDERRKE